MTKKQAAREEEYSPLSGALFRILNKRVIPLYSSLEGMHSPPKEFVHPGLRLRQARERLGLTYREVESASYELAVRRGRAEFILRISRRAEIENRGVVPGLHKFYTLAVVYHLNLRDILGRYDIPIEECFHDGATVRAPQTHVMAPPASLRIPI